MFTWHVNLKTSGLFPGDIDTAHWSKTQSKRTWFNPPAYYPNLGTSLVMTSVYKKDIGILQATVQNKP